MSKMIYIRHGLSAQFALCYIYIYIYNGILSVLMVTVSKAVFVETDLVSFSKILQGTVSLLMSFQCVLKAFSTSRKTSCKISHSLKGTSSMFSVFPSLWNVASVSSTLLFRWLLDFKAILAFETQSHGFQTFASSYHDTFNWMAWQWAETLVEIRRSLADIRGTTKLGCRWNFPKHEFNRPVCLEAHHYLLAHLSQ